MSSSSSIRPESPDFVHSVGHGQYSGQHAPQSVRRERQISNMAPYAGIENREWASRQPSGHNNTAAVASSSSSSRHGSTNDAETSQLSTLPVHASSMSSQARRQSIMAMDRKRRLTSSTHDHSARRRNLNGGFSERDEQLYGQASDAFPSGSRPPNTNHQVRPSSRSMTEVIDLSNSPPPATLSTPTLTRRSSGSSSGIYILPRWQHDSEVSECPICNRPFTFLFRRHHCRKCGRVVCNDCSPHRITIPRQFIVNPPGLPTSTFQGGRSTVDLTRPDEDEDDYLDEHHQGSANSPQRHRQLYNPAFGGGEKVRLCNPCVPDPQPEPQPNFTSSGLPSPSFPGRREDLLSLSDALRSSRRAFHDTSTPEALTGYFPHHPLPSMHQSNRVRPPSLPSRARSEAEFNAAQFGQYSYSNTEYHRHHGRLSFDGSNMLHRQQTSSDHPRTPLLPPNRPRVRSMLDGSYLPRMLSMHAPPAQVRLNEEDICPICRRALPPKGPDGNESAREAHIIDCISARDPSQSTSSSRGTVGKLSPPRGPMHMLPFVATEKDCVSEDGNVPECSICMVEYDVGDELARLECLCKFHRECIGEWFTRKQECPVHKIA